MVNSCHCFLNPGFDSEDIKLFHQKHTDDKLNGFTEQHSNSADVAIEPPYFNVFQILYSHSGRLFDAVTICSGCARSLRRVGSKSEMPGT